MNFRTPIPALFPGASGRIVTALTAHQATNTGAPLSPTDLARDEADRMAARLSRHLGNVVTLRTAATDADAARFAGPEASLIIPPDCAVTLAGGVGGSSG
ncbi:hypothetical protein GCM10010207_75740 [Streptomyces atratus]|uniref:hypothetical protein n=1 Tax=Streptomyces atratus TaxID=1893 RepID=UPI0016704131|nr:hypothetical protein [Streptomyces atratus]GGT65410.1 hypothetical protein GCM10010207_75740 [Streptomyces atratus]